uniref:C-type lectin domain-containing protein n=1 Tax=Astyanax mexicanus TaxID=7994 RepID=A0A3B1ILF6_ASTMX
MDQKWISVFLLFSAVCGVSPYVPHRYHFVDQNKSWTEAQSYCRKTYTDLATINNMDEMKKLNKTLMGKGGNYVWIGLDRGDNGKWRWSLPDENFYHVGDTDQNWNNGEPNNAGEKEFCVAMKKQDGKWFDDNCEKRHTFVCFDGKKFHCMKSIWTTVKSDWLFNFCIIFIL